MARQPIRAITIDALGTLLELLPPAPRLQAELRALGVEVSLERTGRAMKAEIGFYRGHLWMGRDAAGLAELRRRCAEGAARRARARARPRARSRQRCWRRSASSRSPTPCRRCARCGRRA
jgi:hypothetical protein